MWSPSDSIQTEPHCQLVLYASIVLFIASLVLIFLSFPAGYIATETEVLNATEERSVDTYAAQGQPVLNSTQIINYDSLTSEQKETFESLNNTSVPMDSLGSVSELRGNDPYHIQKGNTYYSVDYTHKITFDKPSTIGYGLLLVLAILSGLWARERRVDLRINRLKENPEEFLEERDNRKLVFNN